MRLGKRKKFTVRKEIHATIIWNVYGWKRDIPIVEKVIQQEVDKLGLNIANRLVNDFGHTLHELKNGKLND